MNEILEIYFLRHGETDYNKLNIPQGAEIDSSINESGIEQSIITAKYLKKFNHVPDIIFSSPMKRALETSKIIHKELDLKSNIIIENNLTENRLGILRRDKDKAEKKDLEDYNNLEYEFNAQLDPIEKVKFLESEKIINIWGKLEIELPQETKERCNKIITLIKNCQKNRILIVGHSMFLSLLISNIFNIHIEGLSKKYYKNTKNCFISKIFYCRKNDKFQMITPPNTEHFLSYTYVKNTLYETKEIIGKDSNGFIYLLEKVENVEKVENEILHKNLILIPSNKIDDNLTYYFNNNYGTFYLHQLEK